MVLVPVYVTWVGATLQTNRIGQDRPCERVGLFAIGLCGLVMAVAVPHVYDQGGLLFAVAYVLSRVLLVIRNPPRSRRDMIRPFSAALTLAGPLFVIGALLDDPWRETVWAAAALIDLSMPLAIRRRISPRTYDGAHLAERFGLFVLIALGESIIDIGLPLARQPDLLSGAQLLALGAAFVVVCGLWWTYFDAFNHAMGRLLDRPAETAAMTYHVLYGHLGVVASIVVVAVGFENLTTQPSQPMTLGHLSLLYGGAMGFLLSIAYVWWLGSGRVHGTRWGAAAVLLALLPVATRLSGVGATPMVAVVLLVLCLAERRWPASAVEPRLTPSDERAEA